MLEKAPSLRGHNSWQNKRLPLILSPNVISLCGQKYLAEVSFIKGHGPFYNAVGTVFCQELWSHLKGISLEGELNAAIAVAARILATLDMQIII